MEAEAEGEAGAVESAFDGSDTEVEDIGDLLVGEAIDLAEDQDGAVAFGDGLEFAFEGFNDLLSFEDAVGLGGPFDGDHGGVAGFFLVGQEVFPRLTCIAAASAKEHQGAIGSDAVEPTGEGGGAFEGFEFGEGIQEDVLNDFLGIDLVFGDLEGEAHDFGAVAADDLAEGVFVFAACEFDEFKIRKLSVGCFALDAQSQVPVKRSAFQGLRRRQGEMSSRGR